MSDRYPGGFLTNATPTVSTSSANGIWTLEQQLGYQANGDWPLPPAGAVQISRSLRFNSDDSTYLSRTFSSDNTDRKRQTFSFWVKRTGFGTDQRFINAYDNSGYSAYFQFTSSNAFFYQFGNSSGWGVTTTQVFRDPSAWYHFVIAVDTTQATSSNRIKVYVNGSQVTSFSSATYPDQNAQSQFFVNSSSQNVIGSIFNAGSEFFNGYLANIDFVDGQALDPSYFGQFNATTGVWEPIQTVGYLTYGTNGFHLDFADNSGTTSTTLGKDTSGNGNNWTPNNFSVTAGIGNDSLVDTPTPYGTDTSAGGEVRGNYCTLNPVATNGGTFYQGNLLYVGPGAWTVSPGTIGVSTGKWYWEITFTNSPYSPRSSGSNYNGFGFGVSSQSLSNQNPLTNTQNLIVGDSGYVYNFNGTGVNTGVGFVANDVVGIAVDLDANTFAVYKNGSSIYTGTIGGTAGRELVPVIMAYDGSYGQTCANFGQRPWAYGAPSGYKALCTQNLTTPDVVQGDTAFNTIIWTGTSNTAGRSFTGVGFQPDFVWAKVRSTTYDNILFDAVRSAGSGKELVSDTTGAEGSGNTAAYGYISSFDADGFTSTAGSDGSLGNVYFNGNGSTYVAWNWNAGGSNATNTDGTITSTVRANATAGISVLTYTGNGTAGSTVGHGLGVKPGMIITKGRNTSGAWFVYHAALDALSGYLQLQSTAAIETADDQLIYGNGSVSVPPTSSVFTIGDWSTINGNGNTFVSYVFAPIEGFSAFGSYTGNNNADGPFVYTGFKPAFVMTKRIGAAGNWRTTDDVRNPYNVANLSLFPNLTNAESTNNIIDLLSNGFKLRESNTDRNPSAETVVYAAFAENPFKYALAR